MMTSFAFIAQKLGSYEKFYLCFTESLALRCLICFLHYSQK